jgi:hypothetical protein
MGRASRFKVVVGLMLGMTIAGLPLLNKTVYEREQQVARMRDEAYDAKNMARDERLKLSSRKSDDTS